MSLTLIFQINPQYSEALYSIPPTNSFRYFWINGDPLQNITARNSTAIINLIEGSNISLVSDYNTNSLTISGTGSGSGNATILNDLGDVIISSSGYGDILQHDGAVYRDKLFMINTLSCSGTDKVSGINNQTGAVVCSADQTGSSGATILDELNDVTISGAAYNHILQYRSSSGQWINKLFALNTQSASNDIFITGINNQTGVITTNQFSVNTITPANDIQIIGINNQTGHVTTNQFSVNTISCSGTDKVSGINNQTGAVVCSADQTGSGGGPTVLGSPVTCTSTASYCTIWTIPLTNSQGNYINAKLIADSNTAGVAIQLRVQFDNAGNQGFCVYRTFTTATAEVLDVLAATAATDTGETVWLAGANIPIPLTIECAFETDGSAGNALIQMQMETTGTGTIQAGSYYIKTP